MDKIREYFIKISFKDGHDVILDEDKWDEYNYDGKAFVVKKKGCLVGLYSIDGVVSIVVDTVRKNESTSVAIGHSPTL